MGCIISRTRVNIFINARVSLGTCRLIGYLDDSYPVMEKYVNIDNLEIVTVLKELHYILVYSNNNEILARLDGPFVDGRLFTIVV